MMTLSICAVICLSLLFSPEWKHFPSLFMGKTSSFSSQSSDDRSKVLHLHATKHRNGGEAVAFALLKQMLHCPAGTHHDARHGGTISLEVLIRAVITDSKHIGHLAE